MYFVFRDFGVLVYSRNKNIFILTRKNFEKIIHILAFYMFIYLSGFYIS